MSPARTFNVRTGDFTDLKYMYIRTCIPMSKLHESCLFSSWRVGLRKRPHRLRGPEVDAPQDDMRFDARFDIRLERRLSVELYGEVDHVATLHQAERRRIRPSTRYVDAHGRPSPYDLVALHRHLRMLLVGRGLCRQSLPQQREGAVGVLLATLSTSVLHLRAEHRVVDAAHQVRMLGQRIGQRQLALQESRWQRRAGRSDRRRCGHSCAPALASFPDGNGGADP